MNGPMKLARNLLSESPMRFNPSEANAMEMVTPESGDYFKDLKTYRLPSGLYHHAFKKDDDTTLHVASLNESPKALYHIIGSMLTKSRTVRFIRNAYNDQEFAPPDHWNDEDETHEEVYGSPLEGLKQAGGTRLLRAGLALTDSVMKVNRRTFSSNLISSHTQRVWHIRQKRAERDPDMKVVMRPWDSRFTNYDTTPMDSPLESRHYAEYTGPQPQPIADHRPPGGWNTFQLHQLPHPTPEQNASAVELFHQLDPELASSRHWLATRIRGTPPPRN